MIEPEPKDYNAETELADQRYRALVFMGIILPFLIVPFLTLLIYQKGQSYFYWTIESRFIIWATFLLVFLYARYGEVQRFLLWQENEYDAGFYLQWIIVLYLLCFAAQIISAIPYLLGYHQTSPVLVRMQQIMKLHPMLGIFTVVTAGITEELFFRGYVMSRLALFFKNRHYVVFISAALFCAIHIGYHYWGEIIFTFLIGLTLGYHYYRFRNIKVLIVVHTMIDLVAMLSYIFRK